MLDVWLLGLANMDQRVRNREGIFEYVSDPFLSPGNSLSTKKGTCFKIPHPGRRFSTWNQWKEKMKLNECTLCSTVHTTSHLLLFFTLMMYYHFPIFDSSFEQGGGGWNNNENGLTHHRGIIRLSPAQHRSIAIFKNASSLSTSSSAHLFIFPFGLWRKRCPESLCNLRVKRAAARDLVRPLYLVFIQQQNSF